MMLLNKQGMPLFGIDNLEVEDSAKPIQGVRLERKLIVHTGDYLLFGTDLIDDEETEGIGHTCH